MTADPLAALLVAADDVIRHYVGATPDEPLLRFSDIEALDEARAAVIAAGPTLTPALDVKRLVQAVHNWHNPSPVGRRACRPSGGCRAEAAAIAREYAALGEPTEPMVSHTRAEVADRCPRTDSHPRDECAMFRGQ